MSHSSSAAQDEKATDAASGITVDINHLNDAEVGFDVYRQTKEEGLEWDPKEEKTIVRKTDLWILPIFCMTQGLAYLDKTALNYGNLFGMKS